MTGDGWGQDEDDSPGSDVRARLEGRALLDLGYGTSEGARGPIRVWYHRNPRGSSGTASGTKDGIGTGIGAGTWACSSLSGVLNLTRGRRRDPPLVRTIAVIQIRNRKRGPLMKMTLGLCKANLGLTTTESLLNRTLKTQSSLAMAHTGSVIAKQGSVVDELLGQGKAS